MTYCVTMKVKAGLVGISDTRITSGNQTLTAKKVTIHQDKSRHHAMYIMTAGLRSVRDKALTYFQEAIEENDLKFNKLYKAVNAFAQQSKRVAKEDKEALKDSGLQFNLHALIAGQLEDDNEHKLYLLYPEGNWVEVGESSPFFIIGNSGHGKPLLDRVLHLDSSMQFALKAGFLAFDSTRISANDVDYPIDVVLYKKNSFEIFHHRFQREDMEKYSQWWQENISNAIENLSNDWLTDIFANLEK